MSFGFSVGDFIAVGKLIAQIITSLNSSRGSRASYQELRRELLSLQEALEHVNNLTPATSGQQPGINAITCAALMCRHPLEEFLGKAGKYAGSLGEGNTKGKIKDAGRKMMWAMCMEGEVQKLRCYLSAHVGSVNMLLMSQGLEAMSIAVSKGEEEYKEVCGRLEAQERVGLESREALGRLEGGVGGEVIPRLVALGEAAEREEGNRNELREKLETSNMGIVRVASTLASQGRVGEENRSVLGRLLGTVNRELLPQLVSLVDIVGKVLKSNLQIYNLVLNWQTDLPRPDLRYTWFQDPVKLEDALGRVIPVPSEYGYGKLEAIIKDQFKVGPGRRQVMDGDYELFNTRNSKQVITDSEWTGLLPGMSITMAIIVGSSGSEDQYCPMPHCMSPMLTQAPGGGNICSKCGVWFEQTTRKRKRAVQVEEVEEEQGDEEEEEGDNQARHTANRPRTKRPRSDLSTTLPSVDDSEAFELFKNVRIDSTMEGSQDIQRPMDAMEKVLSKLKAYTPHSYPFLERANKREAPGYDHVIRNPMDLATVTTKLMQRVYKSKQEFLGDLNLIWSNCLRYYADPASPLRRHALAMRKETARLVLTIPNIVTKSIAEENDDSKSHGNVGLDQKKQRGLAMPPRRCLSCNSSGTPGWRPGPEVPGTLCNACGLHYAILTRNARPSPQVEQIPQTMEEVDRGNGVEDLETASEVDQIDWNEWDRLFPPGTDLYSDSPSIRGIDQCVNPIVN